MLGKLFKSKSLQNVGQPPQQPSFASTPDKQPVSFDDSLTREQLYGSSQLDLHPVSFNPRHFRLLISQDGGNLRNKQVLFDSAADCLPSQPSLTSPATTPPVEPHNSVHSLASLSSTRTPPLHKTKSSASGMGIPSGSVSGLASGSSSGLSPKNLHLINDLNDYMFGRGLPSNERYTATKIHTLPYYNSISGSYRAVLVTKLFSILDSSSGQGDELFGDSCWAPHPTLPSKEAHFQPSVKSPGSNGDLRMRQTFNSRFSIGIIIPLENDDQTFDDVVASNWENICYYLIVLQKLASKKLIMALKSSMSNGASPFLNSKRISFPQGILQHEHEIANQLPKLMRLTHYHANIPRIINNHALINYGLQHPNSHYRFNLMNWALEVLNWLEFKDGRTSTSQHHLGHGHPPTSHFGGTSPTVHPSSSWQRHAETPALTNTFLASLIAAIKPLRDSLGTAPIHLDESNESKTVARIVVMTSNMSVAKKLIFILSGLLPNTEFVTDSDSETLPPSHIGKSPTNGHMPKDSRDERQMSALTRSLGRSTISPPPIHMNRISSPISSEASSSQMSHTPDHHEANVSVVKPIPIKANVSSDSDSYSYDSHSASYSSTRGWEVPTKSAASLSFNAVPKATPTTAQQIPIKHATSMSNASSVAYLSSSLNSSLSSSASNYSLSKLGSSFLDRWKNSLVGSQRQSMTLDPLDGSLVSENVLGENPYHTTVSPSPSVEIDEPLWEGTPPSLSSSPQRLRCSRTQSMLNIFNEASKTRAPKPKNLPTVDIDRTRASIYVPVSIHDDGNIEESNAARIKAKVAKIMSQRTLHWKKVDQSIHIEVPFTKRRDSEFEDPVHDDKLYKKARLQPQAAFVDEFRPEYTMQSCPVNLKLEAQVMSAMKNDLLFYQNYCECTTVRSKTLFINLRAREIKCIELSSGTGEQGNPSHGYFGPVSPAPIAHENALHSPGIAHSPITSYFGGDHGHAGVDRRGTGNTYRTTIKKIYTPHKNSGNKELINQVESKLEKLSEIASLVNTQNSTPSDIKTTYNRMLFETVGELLS